MMTIEKFEDCLDRFGADMNRWPDEDAASARALLETSTAAQALFDDAQALDFALDAYDVAPPSAAFEAALLDLAPAPASQTHARKSGGFLDWLNFRMVTTAAAGLACAAIGFVIGVQSLETWQTETEAEAFLTASLPSSEDTYWLGES